MALVEDRASTDPPGADAPAVLPRRRFLAFLTFAALCYLVAPWMGLDSREVDPRIAEVWPPGGVGFVLLSVVWFRGRRLVGTTLGLMFLVFAGTATVMGYGPATSGWLAAVGVAQPVLMILIYRAFLGHGGWAPENPRELTALLFAAISSSVALGLVGGYPMLTPDEAFSKVLLWWVLRNTVFCFVGGVAFMVMFYARRSTVLRHTPWWNTAGLFLTASTCVLGAYYDPALPLSWLLIVPSVWGGLTLTIRGAGYLTIAVALLAASMSYVPQNQFGYTGVLPASSIVDLLVIASTTFLLLLALMREQRETLIAQLDRKGAESESQRKLLETVFDSMTDGVVIVDEGRISMYNAAARQFHGRPMPGGRPESWSRALNLTTLDGEPFPEELLTAGLGLHDGDRAPATSLEVRAGTDTSGRVLNVSAQAIGTDERPSTMLLIHDITAQRARLRELTNFAGMVAHDLRGPLTVLDGWLEVVDESDDTDEELVELAISKARDASRRMRQVIEDWLNYAVVQNGHLRPEPIKLHEVASEILDGRRAQWDEGGAEPQFVLDLTHSVDADPGLLRQLLDNLVGNAVKYTPADQAPCVEIVSSADTEPGWVRVEVRDEGIGIPEGEEQLIFEEFHRGPVEGRTAGTGLGLALTRRIVALHGGEISATRNPGGGSTFTFTLPEA